METVDIKLQLPKDLLKAVEIPYDQLQNKL